MLSFIRRSREKFLSFLTKKSRYDYVLGFGSSTVKGEGMLVVSVRPSVAFRPSRVVIPQDIAKNFLVTSLKIGEAEQLSSVGATPAVLFGDLSYGPRLLMDVAHTTDIIALTLVSQSDSEQVFQAGMYGPMI
jgi:hypothetical protein